MINHSGLQALTGIVFITAGLLFPATIFYLVCLCLLLIEGIILLWEYFRRKREINLVGKILCRERVDDTDMYLIGFDFENQHFEIYRPVSNLDLLTNKGVVLVIDKFSPLHSVVKQSAALKVFLLVLKTLLVVVVAFIKWRK